MSYSNEVIADTPTSYWKMNELSGGITDSMNAVTAIVTGTPKYGVRNYVDQGIDIDSAAGFRIQSIPPSYAWTLGGNLTIEFCMKRNSLDTSTKAILSYRNSTTDGRQYSIFLLSGAEFLFDVGASSSRWSTATGIMDTNWHHLMFKYRGSDGRRELWIDGRLISSVVLPATTSEPAGTDFRIGSGAASSSFNGCLSDVAIYNGIFLSTERGVAHWLAIQNRNAGLVMSAL